MPQFLIFYLFCIAFELNYMYLGNFKHESNEFTRKSTENTQILLNLQNFSKG